MKPTIVVVDDEQDIADLVTLYLKQEQYHIKPFYHAKEAYQYIQTHKVDLAILDVMMPELDGITMCQRLREQGTTFPILMLTAKDGEIDKIKGFQTGADDYITKPFLPMELVARVNAALRRYYHYSDRASEHSYAIKGLYLNEDQHVCTLNEAPLNLTPKEFAILALLCKHMNCVLSPDQIFETVWKEQYYTAANNTVMVHIRHIREKMKDAKEHPHYIQTVWGVGYKIENK